jgi:type IV pilus assembly protein PilM
LGQYAIKAIQLERRAETIVAQYAGHALMPPDALLKGVLVDQRAVALQIKQMVRQSGNDVRAASIAIPIDQLVVRPIDLPAMDGEALRVATRFEARKYLSYPVDKAEVVIVPLGQTVDSEGAPRMRALLASAPRDVVRSRAETLEMAGLEVASVEIEPLALMRAFRADCAPQNSVRGGQPFVYVHLGQKSSGICVVQDTHLRFVHAISWGSGRLTQALAASVGCSLEEAGAIEESAGAMITASGNFSWTDGEGRRETGALMPELERLGREMERLLNYYRSLFPERSYEGILDRLIISGGRANLRGLPQFFSELFQLDVEVRNPFQSIETHLSVSGFAAINGRNHSFAVAVGLALGALQQETRADRTQTGMAREYVWRRSAA